MDDADTAIIGAERLGADLRHDGLEALADRGAAGDDFDMAGRIDEDLGAVRRAEPAFLEKHRKPGADQLARLAPRREPCLHLFPADLLQRLV